MKYRRKSHDVSQNAEAKPIHEDHHDADESLRKSEGLLCSEHEIGGEDGVRRLRGSSGGTILSAAEELQREADEDQRQRRRGLRRARPRRLGQELRDQDRR